jgi:hypothetical protein
LSIDNVGGAPVGGYTSIDMYLNNVTGARWFVPPTSFYVTAVNMGGDRLFAVASANTTLSFHNNLSGGSGGNTLTIGSADCILIITQLQ